MSFYWSTTDNSIFSLRAESLKHNELPPGIYEIGHSLFGLDFISKPRKETNDLIKFDDTLIAEAIDEISLFWKKKELFKNNNFTFKRGILLYGPPGTGKTCAIKMIIDNIVDMGGIALMPDGAGIGTNAIKEFRKIQPDTPLIVVIEDIDLFSGEAELTDLIDGHEAIDNIVFLATTNNLEALSPRLKNRPSRFDKLLYFGPPNSKTRTEYIKYLIDNSSFKGDDIDFELWASETSNLTFAHIKELFLSVFFFDSDFKESLERIKGMVLESTKGDSNDPEAESESDDDDDDYPF